MSSVKPQTFHLVVAAILTIAAMAFALSGSLLPAGLVATGALVAFIHYKAVKTDVVD